MRRSTYYPPPYQCADCRSSDGRTVSPCALSTCRGVRLQRPHAPVGRAGSFLSYVAENMRTSSRSTSMFHDGVRAQVQLDYGESPHLRLRHSSPCSAHHWSMRSYRELRKIQPSSQDLVYLKDARESEDGGLRPAMPLERIRPAAWGLLPADDVGVDSRSPGGFARILAVIVAVCPGFRQTDRRTRRGSSVYAQCPAPQRPIEAAGQRYKQAVASVGLLTSDTGGRLRLPSVVVI